MAPVLVQKAISAEANGNVTSVSVTISAGGAGNLICGMVTCADASSVLNVKDNNGVTYNIVDTIDDSGNGQTASTFYKENISGAPTSIIATFVASTSFTRIEVQEWSGIATTTPLDGHAAQASTGTTVTTQTFTTTVNGDLLYGGAIVDSAPNLTISAGSGFGIQNQGSGGSVSNCLADESQIQGASSASTVATFGLSSSGTAIVFGMAFKAAALASSPAVLQKPLFTPSKRPRALSLNKIQPQLAAAPSVTVSLTGASASAAAGTFVNAISGAIAGASANAAAGTFANAIGITIAGAGVTAGVGSFAKTIVGGLTGANAVGSPGSFTDALIEPFAGAGASAAAGSFTVTTGSTLNVNLTGAAASASAGSFAKAIGTPLPGAGAAAFAAGADHVEIILPSLGTGVIASAGNFSVSAGGTVALTGAAATSGVGSFSKTIVGGLTGANAVGSPGSFTDALIEPFAGAGANAAANTFSVSAGSNANVNLTGAAASASAGNFAKAIVTPLFGVGAVAAAGTLGAGGAAGLAGAAAVGVAGSFLKAITVPPAGVGAASAAGSFLPGIFQFSGAGVAAFAGNWQLSLFSSVPAPTERTAFVSGEIRSIVVPAESRIVFIGETDGTAMA